MSKASIVDSQYQHDSGPTFPLLNTVINEDGRIVKCPGIRMIDVVIFETALLYPCDVQLRLNVCNTSIVFYHRMEKNIRLALACFEHVFVLSNRL